LLNDDSSLVFQGFEFVGDNALVKYRVSQPMSKDAVSNRFYRKLKETQFTQRDSDQREDSNESLLNFMLKLVKEIMSNTPKYDMRHANIGNIADDVAGDLNSTQNIYLNNRRTLSEAATEIQQLLKQLEQTSSNATESERIAYVIENASPTLKNRAISALQAGGETAIDEFFLENKYLKVGKAVIRAWLESSH
jgi:phosphoenolpyruvate carboxylase